MSAAQRTILHAFSTFALGGAQARFVQLANAMSGEGFFHRIAAMDDCYDAGERLSPSVMWEPLRVPNRRGGGLANRRSFREILLREKPDMLMTYNWGAIEWAAANTPTLVQHLHVEDGFGPDEVKSRLPRRIWARRLLLALRRVPTIVASRHLEDIAVSEWWLPASRVAFIPNGVDFDGIAARRAHRVGAKKSRLVIGTVAGLRAEKNVARLIRAFSAVHMDFPARLMIVGDGPERAALERLAQDLGVGPVIEFTGYLKDPLSCLVEFDVFALSSDTEQLPLAMLEAMACGMPVVATDVGDVGLIIPAVARGGLSRPDDASFEQALRYVLEHRDEWESWENAGKERVRAEYSQKGMVDAWSEVFCGGWRKVFRKRLQQRTSLVTDCHS
ncbi:MAG: glycosyltransferase family 4 protein [Candidatus Accumulibacter sp.]|jgi:glycosyltransferase involved in cell wall biosynthesis|nr:glycosyltransferase family 4 protein [Accumulibacter sp.]